MIYLSNKFLRRILISLVLIGLAVLILNTSAREYFSGLTSFFLRFSDNASRVGDVIDTRSREELLSEIEELKRENAQLFLSNLESQYIRNQYNSLMQELDFIEDSDLFVFSRVISRPHSTPYDLITLELPHVEDVRHGLRVRAEGAVEVGRISLVSGNSAVVDLYSSPGTRTPVEINGGSPLVVAEGVGGGAFLVKIPRSFSVSVGDTLTRPGVEGILVAVVEEVERNETDSFLTVRARVPINIFEVVWMEIEKETL